MLSTYFSLRILQQTTQSFSFQRHGLILKRFRELSVKKLSFSVAMPKSNKNKCKVEDNVKAAVSDQSPVYLNKNGSVEVKIVAKPGAKASNVTGIEEEGIGVQIGAPPVDGEANEELIKFISKALDLRKSNVTLAKGAKSRQKTLLITDSSISCDDVMKKIKACID